MCLIKLSNTNSCFVFEDKNIDNLNKFPPFFNVHYVISQTKIQQQQQQKQKKKKY